MMLQRKASLLSLSLSLALAAGLQPTALLFAEPAQAQGATPSAFPLPSSVPSGTTVRVDGSESMAVINQALKQRFEAQYPGTTVTVATQGSDAALKAVLDGSLDLAAVGRPLTEAETQQGLVEAPISREKIAIIVGPNNPFQGDLTFEQFAQIFRGEITDWSQVGGSPGPIRLIDRPEFSDTRRALSNYSVFETAPFQTGANATQLAADDTAALISQLGTDGISYTIANQVLGQNLVRIVPMHGTLPTDPRYPYSQPRGYVYKQGANPAVLAFLGYATSAAGQQAIAEARSGEAAAVAAAPVPSPTPSPAAPEASPVAPVAPAPAAPAPTAPSPVAPAPAATQRAGLGWLPWLLLPLGLLGLLLWALKGRRTPPAAEPVATPPAPPEPVARSGQAAAIPPSPPAIPPVAPTPPAVAPPAPNPLPGAVAGAAGAAAVGLGALALGRNRRSRIVLTPRTGLPPQNLAAPTLATPTSSTRPDLSQAGYAYWEADEAEKAALRNQGGERLTLKIADVTGLDPARLDTATPHSVQSYPCSETDQDRIVPLPQFDRDYVAEIGYLTADQNWLSLARSAPVRLVPPPVAAPVAPPPAPQPAPPPVASAPPVAPIPPAPVSSGSISPPVPPASAASVEPVSADVPVEPPAPPQAAPPVEPPAVPPVTPGTAAPVAAAVGAVAGAVALGSLGRRQSRIALASHAPGQVYAQWEAPEAERQLLRQQGGRQFGLRLYDVTGFGPNLAGVAVQDYECAETEQGQTLTVPEPERDYVAEFGYWTPERQWLSLGRSNTVRVAAPAAPTPTSQSEVEATRFDLGRPETAGSSDTANDRAPSDLPEAAAVAGLAALASASLSSVDDNLPELPDGYGESQLTLLPRDPQWVYAYWDAPDAHKQVLRQQGGQRFALRFYDITDVALPSQNPHSLQQYECDELARDWYIPVPISDRTYIAELGYVTSDGRWLLLARSNPVRVPPVHPADWYDEQFLTVDWDSDLRGQTLAELMRPGQPERNAISDQLLELAEAAEAERIAGSLFGSMQQVPPAAVSSFALASGIGMSGVGMSGIGLSGVGLAASGIGMSGVGMSGVGMSGVGMSGIGFYTSSGVGITSASISGIGMSGAGMSGIGFYSSSGVGLSSLSMSGIGLMSGVGIMSGIGLYTESGIGLYTTSGIGMMSGVGMYTESGIGLYTTSGIGMMSGVGLYTTSGMGMSGAGLLGSYSMSGIGMSGIGMSGYTTSGMGMSGAGLYTTSGMGMSGMGMSGIGMMGYTTSGIGMSGAGLYTTSGIGMSGIGMSSYTTSGMGMSGIGMYSMSGMGMSGIGMSGYTTSGMGMSGIGMYSMSGMGMSGIGMYSMSGIGSSASMPLERSQQFWLTADAELVIHGSTVPNSTVTIAGRPVQVNSDGTFRIQLSFQDGWIDLPILAVAPDGTQSRSVHMTFTRETPSRS